MDDKSDEEHSIPEGDESEHYGEGSDYEEVEDVDVDEAMEVKEDSEIEEVEEEEDNPLNLKDIAFYKYCIHKYNTPVYEDVTAMINSTVPTLIDGDALMLYAVLQDSHPVRLGGQFLHVTYVCERFLDVLKQKGANCVLVFFDLWELAWEKNLPLRTLRRALYHHFKANTTIRTYRFYWYYSQHFQDFKTSEKPRAIMSDIGFDWSINAFNEEWGNKDFHLNRNVELKLFASTLVFCAGNVLPIIDISHVNVGVTLLHSFSISPKLVNVELYKKLRENLLCDLPAYNTVVPKEIEIATVKHLERPRGLILEAALHFLNNYSDPNELRLLLLYYAAKFTLPPENRAPPETKYDENFLETVQNIVGKWHNSLNIILHNVHTSKIGFNFQHIGDLWQGTLFACILNLTRATVQNGNQLGSLYIEYEGLINDLNIKCEKIGFNPYPIEPILQGDGCIFEEEENTVNEMIKLSKIDSPLINKFCENIFNEVRWENPAKVFGMKRFFETRHWHCRRLLEDDFPDDCRRSNDIDLSKKAKDRAYQKQFKYINIYGQNLEGTMSQYNAIIYQNSKKSKTTPKKQSQSSKLMQKKIQEEKMKTALEQDKKELNMFNEKFNPATDIKQLKEDLRQIKNIINRMSCPETIMKGNLLKLKILKPIVTNETGKDQTNCIKDILLTIRAVLRMRDEGKELAEFTEKDKRYISKLLHLYGFGEIALRNGLPIDKHFKKEYKYNWVRFQLEHLGADLLQENNNTFDPDVNFAPDKWQVDFIEAIRHNESALVVAPTSSGKTFACYYCMKRVLQYSLDGIVIYVAPTKALVNQVAATITYRFKNTKLPEDGTSLVGVFTRDYRMKPTTSRILITVPQCLDILLMSPKQFKWNKKIKYVIFDEVHRLSGNEEGLVWERLLLMIQSPFLALSATISDAHLFHKWLQNMEHFKQEQDKLNDCLRESYKVRCIIHEERHADLIKHVYAEGCLQDYHPYCTLHRKILLDRGKIPESITLSPKETIQLYDLLLKYAKQYIPTKMNYLDYFGNRTESGFLTRKSVRDFEKEMGNIFYKIYEDDDLAYDEILNELIPLGYRDSNTDKRSLIDGYMLLNHMADNDMLPAIVFSYDRSLVEDFCRWLLPTVRLMSDGTRKLIDKTQELKSNTKQPEKMKERSKKGDKKVDVNDEGRKLYVLSPSRNMWRNPINILAKTPSKFKGIGKMDSEDLEFIERRLYHSYLKHSTADFRCLITAQFQSGLAYHHAGLDKKLRDTAEMLFRLGIVKVVVATGTLALGVHMPCKSVVVFGDSTFLNSLEYHQMSGRAGRRGFDNEGHVIFLNLAKERHDMLMTDKLPKMLGNYPINVTLVARLLLFVSNINDTENPDDEYTKITTSRALTLLENSLLFEVKPHLKQQIKQFVGFAVQLLLMQDIINKKGFPMQWCSFVTHLHYHEPANLALTYLIRCGAFTELVKSTSDDKELQWQIVVILSHLFTRIPFTEKIMEEKKHNSVVKLEPMPNLIQKALLQYNKEVQFVFNQYFLSVARHLRPTLGEDNTLPLSKVQFNIKSVDSTDDEPDSLMQKVRALCYQRELTSAFVALSGNKDNKLYTHRLISNIRHEICPEIDIVPAIYISRQLNGYALDFYRHGTRQAIVRDNGLKQGNDFIQLNDFRLVINTIVLSLEDLELEGAENARFLLNLQEVRNKYNALFEKAYYFRRTTPQKKA